MKEKNKNNNIEQIPSKGKIAFAWILLIVLSTTAGLLVYAKHLQKLENEKIESIETPSNAVVNKLTLIINNYNKKITPSEEEIQLLKAKLSEQTIEIFYIKENTTNTVKYTYDQASTSLISINDLENKEINDKIFKMIVISCLESNNINLDVSTDIDNFIKEEIEITGITKETNEENYTYKINLVTLFKDKIEQSNQNTSSTEENITLEETDKEQPDTDLEENIEQNN